LLYVGIRAETSASFAYHSMAYVFSQQTVQSIYFKLSICVYKNGTENGWIDWFIHSFCAIENISFIMRCHYYRWKAVKLDLS
jgi:hypothetical protein